MSRLVLALLLAGAAAAQTASITGRITDSTGAVVQGARISATAVASGVETAVETSDQGYYS
ncbi:MAG: carboxypeptidase-like regulatory domain-containing protein, partial [Bryobacteraceae bacterium]